MISKWNKYIMKKTNLISAGHAEIKKFNIFNFILPINFHV